MDLSTLTQAYEKDQLANIKASLEYKEALKYYHGHQLDILELNKLETRGQIPIHENIFKMICDKILGYKIQARVEIKVNGRQDEDKILANLLTDLLKVFNQSENYDKEIYKRDFSLLLGLAVLEVWINQDKDGYYHISIKHIPIDSFLIDCYSYDKNALDAQRFHKKQHIALADAKDLIGDKEIFLNENDLSDQRAFIIESWIREYDEEAKEPTWNRYLWHPQGGIYKKEVKPFKDNIHPFIVAKYQSDENNDYYGLFRDIKPLQDYINFAENKMANMLYTQKAIFEIDAVDEIDTFVENISKDNAIVAVRSGTLRENKIQFIEHHADINALSAKSEQKRNIARVMSGLNDEALAQATNRQSGVAIAQRRDAGLLGLQYFIQSSDNMDRILYQRVLSLIQNYFNKRQVFAIAEKRRAVRYFSINDTPENTIHIGAFDLVYSTQLKIEGREERFAHWTELLKTLANIRADIVDKVLPFMLKDTDSQIADDIEEILAQADEMAAQNAQPQQEYEQEIQRLTIEKLKAEIEKIKGQGEQAHSKANLLDTMKEQDLSETTTQENNAQDNANNKTTKPKRKKPYINQLTKIDLR